MSDLLDRVRRALAAKYDVESYLGAGGMGAVFRARHRALDKPVAIKVIKPGTESAERVERFRREAAILAAFRHPHIVPVHDQGELNGIVYYEMDLLEGNTVADLLEHGPLGPAAAERMARQLLGALAEVHARGVIHRDIKPSNVFLVRGDAVLVDFGIAKSPPGTDEALTAPFELLGTLAFMPPEQRRGEEVTARTDLYALALTVYPAATGRLWDPKAPHDRADWRGVPHRLAAALQQALEPKPDDRWPDAAAFLRALEARAPVPGGVVRLGSATVGVVLVAYLLWRLLRPALPVLAIEPLGCQPGLGEDLSYLAAQHLQAIPHRMGVVPPNQMIAAGCGGRVPGATHVASGRVTVHGDSLDIHLFVRPVESADKPATQVVVRAAAGDKWRAAGAVAARLFEVVTTVKLPQIPRPTESPEALDALLKGDSAWRADDWRGSEAHLQRTLSLDPGFAYAAWRLWNVQRWRRIPRTVDLRALLADGGRALPRIDSLLVAAELAPPGAPRQQVYVAARAVDPNDGYAALLHANDLFHRGPLIGIAAGRGTALADTALQLYPTLTPAWDQLIWGLVQAGLRDSARRVLNAMPPQPPGGQTDVDRRMLELAWLARFDTATLRHVLADLPPALEAELFERVRLAMAFDAPAAQLLIGRRAATASRSPERRAGGHTAAGIALLALGRPAAGLAQFDSAATLAGSPVARLQAAQWRVVPGALGLTWVPASDRAAGLAALRGLAADSALGHRAAWTLALAAAAEGDTVAVRRWGARLRADSAGRWLEALVAAHAAGVAGDIRDALERSEPLLDAAERFQVGDPLAPAPFGDPFARAVLHLTRASWHEARGDGSAAARELLWSGATDFEGWLTGAQQAAEIDWAFGVYARARRGALALEHDAAGAGCAALRRAVEIWSDPEPVLTPTVEAARARLTECPP